MRGLSAVTLALIDEATLIDRALRDAVSPMLSTTGGPMWAMGTAKGESGWFYDDWQDDGLDFIVKSKVTWREVPHLDKAYIEKERRRMPAWQFEQEYNCEFVEDGETQLISAALIDACRSPEVHALW